METFQKEVSFLSNVPGEKGFEIKQVEKLATFKELDQRDKLQHKLHFRLLSIMEGFSADDSDQEEKRFKIDPDALYDLTTKAVNTLYVPTAEFTVQDKTEFLNDSAAILRFGLYFMGEKITPFFLKLNLDLKK